MWPSDQKIQEIIDALSKEFGEDLAMDALERMGRTIKRGQEITNPFGYCWCTAENLRKNEWRDRERLASYDPWTTSQASNGTVPYTSLLDLRDPAVIIESREILDSMPVDFVMDTPLSLDEERWQEPITGMEATRRWRIRRATRAKFEL